MAYLVPSAFIPPTLVNYTVPSANPFITTIPIDDSPSTPPIGPITGISVTNITTTGFTVNWNIVALAKEYSIHWGNYNIVTNYLTCTFTNLPPDTTDNLIIFAINEDGSISSTPQSVSTALPPPAIPTGVYVSSITYNSMSVAWDSSQYATSYTCTWGAYTGVVSGTTATFTGLPGGTINTLLVSAINSSGTTPGLGLPVTTPVNPPTAPTGIVVSAVTNNGFTATWTAQLNVTYTATWGSYNAQSIVNTTAIFNGLPALTTNNLVITATNVSGSASSTPIPVTTSINPPAKPTGLATTIRGTNYFHAGWTLDPAVTTYTATFGGAPITVVGNATAPTGLATGITADLIVYATNSSGTTASDPYSISLLSPITVFQNGIAPLPPGYSAPSVNKVWSFNIPADFDIGNNDTSSPEFITIAGSYIGYDPTNPTADPIDISINLNKTGAAVNTFSTTSIPGNNYEIVSGWSTSNSWSLTPSTLYDMYLTLGGTIATLDTNNLQYQFIYNPFASP